MITVEKTTLPGVLLIKPEIFEDFRGTYTETYNDELYKKMGITAEFIQDDYSLSKQNVLRGLHGDEKTWKLVSCPLGELFFAVVNCDKESADFGKSESFLLNEKNKWQVLVPPKHGNGHLVLSERGIFAYKQSTYYEKDTQFSYRYDSPSFGINWPVTEPILSERDSESQKA
jgi:dTDP-4-dehydrorhamnose 3,5-epimerase